MKISLIILFFLGSISNSLHAQQTDDRLTGLDTFVNRVLKEWSVAGAAIAIVKNNKVHLTQGFGFKDFDKKSYTTENTLFPIGSGTKPFTAALLSFPLQERRLDLDKPVNQYLPELRFAKDELTNGVTVKDMMCHRTGLPRHDLIWYSSKTTRDSLVHFIRYLEPTAPLRQRWQYNNFMFIGLGKLAEKLSGKTWESLISEKFFDPLNMLTSNMSVTDLEKTNDFSFGYREKNGQIIKLPFMNIDAIGPAGAINSNAKEMANWLLMWVNGGRFNNKQVLPPSYYTQAISSQMVIGGRLPGKANADIFFYNYGLGWFLTNYRGHYCVEHGGSIDGFTSLTSFFPADSIGIFVVVNQNVSQVPAILRNVIADRMLSEKYHDWHGSQKAAMGNTSTQSHDPGKRPSARPLHSLNAYVGSYENAAYGIVKSV